MLDTSPVYSQFIFLIFAWCEMGSYFNSERKKTKNPNRIDEKIISINLDLIKRWRWHWIYSITLDSFNASADLVCITLQHVNRLNWNWKQWRRKGRPITHHEWNPSKKSHNLNVLVHDAFRQKRQFNKNKSIGYCFCNYYNILSYHTMRQNHWIEQFNRNFSSFCESITFNAKCRKTKKQRKRRENFQQVRNGSDNLLVCHWRNWTDERKVWMISSVLNDDVASILNKSKWNVEKRKKHWTKEILNNLLKKP